MRIRGVWLALLGMCLGASAAPTPAQDQDQDVPSLKLTFGIYPTDRATETYKMFIPVLETLQERMEKAGGRPVDIDLKLFRNYAEGIEALAKGEVDFVRFGPASYVSAKRKNEKITLLAMEHKKGKKRFEGVIVVAKDSPIQRMQDLKGKRFAFGDRNSTIGRYLCQAELVKAGICAPDLRSYQFYGRHDKVAEAVRDGKADAGAVKMSTFKKVNEDDSLRVIHTFENVTKPWIARGDLDSTTFDLIRQTLVKLDDQAALEALGVDGFLDTNDDEYKFCRQGMKLAAKFDR